MGVNIYLKNGKNKDGRTSLYILAQSKGRKFKRSLPIKVYPKDWIKTKYQVKTTTPGGALINRELRELNEHLLRSWEMLERGAYNWEEFCKIIGKVDSNTDIESHIRNTYKDDYSYSTFQAYLYSYRAFLKALEKDSLRFDELTQANLDNAVSAWKKGNKSPESIKTYLKHLTRISKRAYSKGLSSTTIDGIKSFKFKKTTRIIPSVTSNQYEEAIKKVNDLVDFQSMSFWLLMFCMRGLYPKDLVEIHKRKYENRNSLEDKRYVKHERSKTGELMKILYSCTPTESIINSLHLSLQLPESNRTIKGFSIIPKHQEYLKFFDCSEDNYKNIWDIYIKRITPLLGHSFKVARKTFETYAVKLEVSSEITFRLLGHQDKTIKSSYRNWEWEELVKKVDAAHLQVLEEFQAKLLWQKLLERAKEINLPDRIHDGTVLLF